MENAVETKNITVTIGIPTYNGADFVREAIDSALSQTFTDFELIISDDCSTDDTDNICREYTLKDHRIHYIRHNKNLGGFLNISYIIRQAKGAYITLLAQDDALENNFLEATVNYFSRHEQCVLVSGDFEIIDQAGLVIRVDKLEKVREIIDWKRRRLEFFRYPIAKTFFCIYGLMRSEIMKDIYANMPYPKKIFKGSEMPLLSRFATQGEIASIPQVLRKYRQHNQSAYNVEFKNTKSESFLKRKFIILKNIYAIRFDQLKVLLHSNYPPSQKFYIFFFVYFEYLKTFLLRLLRLPKKLWALFNKKK